MIDEVEVAREEAGTRGRYVVYLKDGHEAELTYARREGNVLVADHTYVPHEFRGQGIADQLVGALIENARREGTKIVPLCSYVAAQFRRNPEWADLLA